MFNMASTKYFYLLCVICFIFGIFFIHHVQSKPFFGFLKNLFTTQNEEEYSEFDSLSRRCSELYERVSIGTQTHTHTENYYVCNSSTLISVLIIWIIKYSIFIQRTFLNKAFWHSSLQSLCYFHCLQNYLF